MEAYTVINKLDLQVETQLVLILSKTTVCITTTSVPVILKIKFPTV